MGKGQKKTGKGRLDKYYKLAKCVVLLACWSNDAETTLQESRATARVRPSSSFS
jgi:hypothetical protein